MKRVYLDYSATTPLDPRVLVAMSTVFSQHFGNASSVHSFGRETRAILEKSRDQIASFIGAKSDEVYFTSGGTESDNYALKGLALAGAKKGKNEIITSVAEHHAVLHSAESLQKAGFEVRKLPVDGYGRVDPAEVKKAITPKTALISLMHVNNEVGSLNAISEIGMIAREADIPMHSDAVQSVGKIRVNVRELNVDVLSISAHKFYGPKGIGAIYIRKGTQIESFIEGGAQESNRRGDRERASGGWFFRRCRVGSRAHGKRSQPYRRTEGETEQKAHRRFQWPRVQRSPDGEHTSHPQRFIRLLGESARRRRDHHGAGFDGSRSHERCSLHIWQPSAFPRPAGNGEGRKDRSRDHSLLSRTHNDSR